MPNAFHLVSLAQNSEKKYFNNMRISDFAYGFFAVDTSAFSQLAAATRTRAWLCRDRGWGAA